MPYLSLNVEMYGRTTLVVGGGAVARRKIRSLLGAGARVRVVTLATNPELDQMQTKLGFTVRTGTYSTNDLDGVFLVVAASDCIEVNSRIAQDAQARNILVAVANAPKLGNCTFPAVFKRGELEIAVASSGRCPAFSAAVRDYLAGLIGEGFGAALEQVAIEREKLLTEGNGSTYNAEIVRTRARNLIAALLDAEETP